MRRPGPYWSWCIPAALAMAPWGCREELGPTPLRTARVSGVVTVGGRPVTRGWVEFLPTRGTVGNLRSAVIRPDGSFEADRVAVGRNAIGIVDAPLEPTLRDTFHPFATPILRSIPERAPGRLDIDLLDELLRFQKAKEKDLDTRPGPEPAR